MSWCRKYILGMMWKSCSDDKIHMIWTTDCSHPIIVKVISSRKYFPPRIQKICRSNHPMNDLAPSCPHDRRQARSDSVKRTSSPRWEESPRDQRSLAPRWRPPAKLSRDKICTLSKDQRLRCKRGSTQQPWSDRNPWSTQLSLLLVGFTEKLGASWDEKTQILKIFLIYSDYSRNPAYPQGWVQLIPQG